VASDDEEMQQIYDEELWQIFGRRRGSLDRREQRVGEHFRELQDRGHPAPRRVRSLSRDEIVRVAIKVADAEGPGAISMRRIARELNAGAMSLYWHVSSKDELLDLMLDALEGEQEFPAPTGDWQEDMRAIAHARRDVLRRHAWLMDFIGGRPPLGPNTLRNLERSLAVLSGPGLGTEWVLNALSSVAAYVMGAVLREFREAKVDERDQELIAEIGEETLRAQFGSIQEKLEATGRFPHMMRMYAAGIDPDSPHTRDQRFEFGLRCLVAGLADTLPGPPAPAPGPPAPAPASVTSDPGSAGQAGAGGD
jgi:AcrR family transcriptional regulator